MLLVGVWRLEGAESGYDQVLPLLPGVLVPRIPGMSSRMTICECSASFVIPRGAGLPGAERDAFAVNHEDHVATVDGEDLSILVQALALAY